LAAGASVSGESYEILDGVRRAKAAQTVGHGTIPARIDDGSGALGPVIDLPIDSLRSPKDFIDASTAVKFKRFKESLDKARQGLAPPPIIVIRGRRGRSITDVGIKF